MGYVEDLEWERRDDIFDIVFDQRMFLCGVQSKKFCTLVVRNQGVGYMVPQGRTCALYPIYDIGSHDARVLGNAHYCFPLEQTLH